ncbi:MAG: hypothetical protein K8T20_14665 [Planctomycetes bacterium]|nr:hypothetical protein [Planctomycetota bacterium]
MELYGILLAGPAAFIAAIVYCTFLDWFLADRPRASKAFFRVSLIVLGLIGAEVAVLAAVGAVRVRGTLGPGFEAVHLVLVILGTPALANALALRLTPGVVARWFVVAPLCAIFAVALILMQFHVHESLYGIEECSPMASADGEVERLFEAELLRRNVKFTRTADGRYAYHRGDTDFLISLENLARDFARDRDESRVARFAEATFASTEVPPWEAVRDCVYWGLEQADTEMGDTFRRKVSDKVVKLLVVTDPEERKLTFITPGMARDWKTTDAELEASAARNLDRLIQGQQPEFRVIDGCKIGMLPVRSVFKSSVIFAPGFRKYVEPTIGWPVLAVIPDREFIYVIAEKDKELLSRMGKVVQDQFRKASYPLSTEVFRISDEGIEAIGAFPE